MGKTVREVTYDVLRSLGIRIIFGNPGSSELPFLRDMPSDFQYILALHERSAAGIALGYAIGKRQAAFVNLHSIASAGNGMSAIVDACFGHVPLVISAGQQDRRHVLAEPFLVSRAVDVVKPYVKWAYEPLRAQDVPAAIARGYYLAMQPPRGPVFISIPMDDWNRQSEVVVPRWVSQRVLPDFRALDAVVHAVDGATKLAVVVGSQVEEDEAWDEVLSLAEYLNAPVFEEPIASRWTFPRTHRLFQGGLLPAQEPLAGQLGEYDTILVLGAPIFLYYAFVPGDTVRPGTTLFQITNAPSDAASALVGTSIVGDIAAAANYIRSRLTFVSRRPPSPRPTVPPHASEYPMTAAYVFGVLNELLPPDAIIAEECPSSKGDLDRNVLLDGPCSFYSVRTGILGFAVPLAVGLQLANPRRKVVAPVGDGSIQYSIQALWTAVQYNAPVMFLVLNNGDYSALKGFCRFTGVGPNVPGTEIPGIDMTKLAAGYGMIAWKVERPEELRKVLLLGLASAKPCLITVDVQSGGQTCMGMDMSVNPPNYG